MTLQDIENLPIKDVLGVECSYIDEYSGRKRKGLINSIAKTRCTVRRKDGNNALVHWKEVISIEAK